MPTSLYGPAGNFDLTSSHVLPVLVRKFHDDKIRPAGGTRSTCDCFLAHEASLRGVGTAVV